MSQNSTFNILRVAIAVCLACSVVVSVAAVFLRPLQVSNKALDQKINILQVAGIWEDNLSIEEMFSSIETRLVELDTGKFNTSFDVEMFNQRKSAKDSNLSISLSDEQDIANINRRENYAKVYLVKDRGAVKRYVLPVHGYGLWSTLYGYVTLEADLNTVYGIKFYDHKETPGLGGEVDNPKWQAQWKGKKIFSPAGDVALEIKKGTVVASDPNANYQIDGLSGATLTSNGVTNMFKFWMGKDGFGHFIQQQTQTEDAS